MHLRLTLILLLVTSVLAMLVLLPRSPMVLGWLWDNAQDIASEQGFLLTADRLHGNAWGGVTIEGLSLQGPGTDLYSSDARIEYGLLSLLTGRLTLAAELSGVRGSFDPAPLVVGGEAPAAGAPELPINLQRLALSDINISVAEFELYLPAISVDELEVSSEADRLVLGGALTTPDGSAEFSGFWQPDSGRLDVDVSHADVTIARHWWPPATGGTVTAALHWSAETGFGFDASVHNGSIDFLEVVVDNINGPVVMRDLVIDSELHGSGLDGPVSAEIQVDIPRLNYHGVLTGSPRLDAAIPWLGRNIGIDLQQIPAEGPMSLQVIVTGWDETHVTGTASGTGTLAGMELEALQGDFGYRTVQGISVDARASLAGGQLNVRLLPDNPRVTELAVAVTEVEPLAGYVLNGQGSVHFDSSGADPLPSNANLTLSGDLPGEQFTVTASGASSDTTRWAIDLTGLQDALSGQVQLDLATGSASGSALLNQLELPGLPWPVDAELVLPEAPLQLPLVVSAAAQTGPLQLAGQDYSLQFEDGVTISALSGSLQLQSVAGITQLLLQEQPLLLELTDQPPVPIPLTGDLRTSTDGLEGELSSRFELLGQPVSAAATAEGGAINLTGSTGLLGLDWLLTGSLAPELDLSVSSSAGTVTLMDTSLAGSGQLPIPAGVELLSDAQWQDAVQWQLTGDLLEGGATLTAAGSSLELDWQDGFGFAAAVDEQLRVAGQEVRLAAELAPDGTMQGRLERDALSLDLAGQLVAERLELTGDFPAGAVQNVLAGEVQLRGALDWQDGLRLAADLAWHGLTASLAWQPEEPVRLDATAPGLSASFEAGQLLAELTDFDSNPFVDLPVALPPLSGLVTGPLEQLQVDVAGTSGWLDVQLSGSLGPELDLNVSAGTPDDLARLEGSLLGSLAQPEISGQLVTPQFGSQSTLGIEPLNLEIGVDATGRLTATGTGIDLALDSAGWTGRAEVGLWLLDERHVIQLEPAGAGLQPDLHGSISGALVTGEVQLAETVDLQLQLAGDLPGLNLPGTVSLSATADLSGNWAGRLQATAAGPTVNLEPLTLGAELAGDLAGFNAVGNVRAGPEATRLLTVSAASDWSSLTLSSDMASLALDELTALFGVATQLQPDGLAELTWQESGLDWQVAGSLTGAVAGVPADVSVSAAQGQLTLVGSVAGEPLAAELTTGVVMDLHADWGGALLQATMPEFMVVTAELTAPEGTPLGAATNLELSTRIQDDQTELAYLRGAIGPVGIDLGGPLFPDTALHGTIQVPGLAESLPLQVTGAAGLTATTGFEGLQLSAGLDSGELQLRLTGTSDDGTIHADLDWTTGQGFAGSASAAGALAVAVAPAGLPWSVSAQAAPDGRLEASAELRFAGRPDSRSPLGQVQATIGRQPFAAGSLSGNFTGYLNLLDVWPAAGHGSLTISSSGRLAGSVLDPSLSGSVMLRGAAEASGRIDADLDGVRLDVSGERTMISGSLDQSGWQLAANLGGVRLEQISDLLAGAAADIELRGQGSFADGDHELLLDSATVMHDSGSIVVSGGFRNGALDAAANVELDLSALPVGFALTGRIAGTLNLTDWQLAREGSGSLSGSLGVTDLGVPDSPGLAGNIVLAGTPAAPQVTAGLQSDSEDDNLVLDWQPALGNLRLTARLDLGAVQTDLYLESGRDAPPSGAGTVTVPGGSFTLGTLVSGEFLFTGHAAWAGWGLMLDPQAGVITASGDMASLSPEADGFMELSASLGDAGVQFGGGLTGLRVLGVDLGDIAFGTMSGSSSGISLAGELLEGHIRLDGAWQLDRIAIRVAQDLDLVASASGNLASGSINTSLSGSVLGMPLTGQVSAALSAVGLTVEADLEALGGTAEAQALLRDGNWQGTVELIDLLYSGIELNGSGQLFGPAADPRLELTTDANLLGIPGQGTLQLGRNLLRFHQTFEGDLLGGQLVFQGSLWPEPQLLLSDEGGNVFRLDQTDPASQQPVLSRSLISSGQLNLQSDIAAVMLRAAADGRSAGLSLELPLLPGFEVDGDLQLSSLRALLAQFDDGVQLRGRGETAGELTLNLLSGQLDLNDFGLLVGPGHVLLDGYVNLNGSARLSGQFRPTAEWLVELPALAGNGVVPFALISSGGIFRFVSNSSLGDIEASYGLADNRGTLSALLRSGDGNADLRLAWSGTGGLTGTVSSAGFVLFDLPGGPPGLINADLDFTAGEVRGTASLTAGSGRLNASGNWALGDLLPRGVDPLQLSGGQADLRISSLEVSELPPVALYAPALSGNVTAVVQLRNEIIAGNLIATDLQAAGSPLPIEAVISGSPRSVEIGAELAGSPLSVTIEDYRLSGLLEMRRFPLQTFAEAAAGSLDVLAEVTGVMRFNLPLLETGSSTFSVATEHIHLERSGIVTTGNVSMELADGSFRVSEASFSGAGSWEASGVLQADLLDFELIADDADFGPMLGLIPVLNQLGVSAEGSLRLTAAGDLADPLISLESDSLDFELAGISYRLDDLLLELAQNDLTLAAELLATDPIQGALTLSGSGGLNLSNMAFQNARLEFDGSLVLPVIGQLEAISGSLHSVTDEPGAPLVAELDALLGNPLSIRGSLAPLDLTLTGTDLLVDLSALFLADSRLDANLNLRDDGGLVLGGQVTLREGQISLGGGTGTGPGPSATGFGENFRFDNLRVLVPARLRLAESFGSAELSGDVTVTGTVAEPELSGRADAIRGNFQFSGRDFALQDSAVIFEPARGIYPELRINATTSFDRGRLLPPGSNLQLVAPAEGSALVTLSFIGTVEPDPLTGIRLDLNPVLSSNVLVRPAVDSSQAAGPRPLTEDELLALVTLGRVDFESFGGESGLAPVVAQGAIETAIDLLIMSEFQRALGEALGLDLVEIRSSALANILSGAPQDQQFGVSLRFGGYVSDEVFATYRVSAFDDPQGIYAFSNEVGIRYALGPILLDLAGSLGVTDTAELSAVAQLSLGVQYEFNPNTTIEAAFDVSSEEQLFRFGVTWRW